VIGVFTEMGVLDQLGVDGFMGPMVSMWINGDQLGNVF